eukprot:m51a1_g13846 hypothetical protein (426) ;mRNA; f:536413-538078
METDTQLVAVLARAGLDPGPVLSLFPAASPPAVALSLGGSASLYLSGPRCTASGPLTLCWLGTASPEPPAAPVAAAESCAASAAAFVAWDSAGCELWWGRDALGQRSLLLGTHAASGSLVLCRRAPAALRGAWTWSEVPAECLWVARKGRGFAVEAVELPSAEQLQPLPPDLPISARHVAVYGMRRRSSITPTPGTRAGALEEDAAGLLASLESAVRRSLETANRALSLDGQSSSEPVAVLYSGGLDSSVLAALAGRVLPPGVPIELLNVSFADTNSDRAAFERAPDRIAAAQGVQDLRRAQPGREWRLVRVDVCASEIAKEAEHIMGLAFPTETVMDATIAVATWRLIVGQGSDEQFAGYTRHRKAFNQGGWERLQAELDRDMGRLWLRNMGRDDRILSDCGRLALLPFLDPELPQAFRNGPFR